MSNTKSTFHKSKKSTKGQFRKFTIGGFVAQNDGIIQQHHDIDQNKTSFNREYLEKMIKERKENEKFNNLVF